MRSRISFSIKYFHFSEFVSFSVFAVRTYHSSDSWKRSLRHSDNMKMSFFIPRELSFAFAKCHQSHVWFRTYIPFQFLLLTSVIEVKYLQYNHYIFAIRVTSLHVPYTSSLWFLSRLIHIFIRVHDLDFKSFDEYQWVSCLFLKKCQES